MQRSFSHFWCAWQGKQDVIESLVRKDVQFRTCLFAVTKDRDSYVARAFEFVSHSHEAKRLL